MSTLAPVIDGPRVDLFSSRLTKELDALSWQARNDLIVSIGRMELRMRSTGQERPLWRGPAPVDQLLGANVVVPTEQGERRGRVVAFGVVQNPEGIDYERSVIVHVPSSGTHHEAAGSLARLANPEDLARIRGELEMARKLAEAGQGRIQTTTARPRRRGDKDPVLFERMLTAAKCSANVKSIEEGTANFKVTGLDGSKRIYLFKSQLRVDISGFSVEHPGIRTISEAEARDMHLGKVRGQLLFDDRETAFAAFELALVGMA